MKVYVLDASAWVKRYKNESGSNSIDALFQALEQGEVESCLLPIVYYDLIGCDVKDPKTDQLP